MMVNGYGSEMGSSLSMRPVRLFRSAIVVIALMVVFSLNSLFANPAEGLNTVWTRVSAGWDYTCAVTAGKVFCWGNNSAGQIGLGYLQIREPRSKVYALDSVTEISAGLAHVCALKSDKTIWCWGSNEDGQIGFDVPITGQGPGFSAVPQKVSGISTAKAVASGKTHTCAIYESGTENRVKCWGSNDRGQLGQISDIQSTRVPLRVNGITNAIAITAGEQYTCALLATQRIACWGKNDKGQLGNNTNTDSVTPQEVRTSSGALTLATSVSGGNSHVCARRTDSTVWCWGWNQFGQLGDDSTSDRNRAVSVYGITTATSLGLGVGHYHSCAVLSGGSIKCWGSGSGYKLGNNSTSDQKRPVTVSGITTGSRVQGGDGHACGLKSDGSLWCWGDNLLGEVVDTLYPNAVKVPTQVGN